MTDYIYLPTPISEKPEYEDHYSVILESGAETYLLYCDGKWQKEPKYNPVTHYLRKVPRQEYDREVREGFVEWVAKQGWLYNKEKELWVRSRLVYNSFNKFEDQFARTADLLQTYLETL